MSSLLSELKRRQMLKAVVAYCVVAYLFAQIAFATFPIMRLPEWTVEALLVVLLLLFPFAMYKAWVLGDEAEGKG